MRSIDDIGLRIGDKLDLIQAEYELLTRCRVPERCVFDILPREEVQNVDLPSNLPAG